MATNRAVVTDALRLLGVIRPNQAASAEDARTGLSELNDLMADLASEFGIDVGYFTQSELSADCPMNDDDISAIKPLLAMRLSIHFPSSEFPQALPERADKALRRMVREAVIDATEPASLTNLPLGSGWYSRGGFGS